MSYTAGQTKESTQFGAATFERVVVDGAAVRLPCPHAELQLQPQPGPNTARAPFESATKTFGPDRGPLNEPGPGAHPSEEIKWFRNHVPLEVAVAELGAHRAQLNPWRVNQFGELLISRMRRDLAGKYSCLFGGRQSELLLDVLQGEKEAGNFSLQLDGSESSPSTGRLLIDKFEPRSGLESGPARQARDREELVGGGAPPEQSRGLSGESSRTGNGQIGAPSTEAPPEPSSEGGKLAPLQLAGGTQSPAKLISDPPTGREGKQKNDEIRLSFAPLPLPAGLVSSQALVDSARAEPFSSLSDRTRTEGASSLGAQADRLEEQKLQTNETSSNIFSSPTKRLNGGGGHGDGDERDSIRRAPEIQGEPLGGGGLAEDKDVTMNADRLMDPLGPKLGTRQLGVQTKAPRKLAHLVKSETISSADLSSIPGLLYTKQHFYCPQPTRARLFDLLREQISAFAGQICSRLLAESLANGPSTGTKCRRLARILLVSLIRTERNCAKASGPSMGAKSSGLTDHDARPAERFSLASFLNVVWFKHNDGLYFGSQQNKSGSLAPARHKHNIKLIDSLLDDGQFPSGPDGQDTDWNKSRSACDGTKKAARLPGLAKSVLEIDGLRREDAGRYSCAFRLNSEKLLEIFIRLRPSVADGSRWPNCLYENDKSLCCDARHNLAAASASASVSPLEWEPQRLARQQQDVMDSTGASGAPGTRSGHQMKTSGVMDSAARSAHQRAFLAQLEALLSGQLDDRAQTLDRLQRAIASSLESIPATKVQTFFLLVVERPANSSSLWSSIVGANNAYSRRKSADFRQLKRGLMSGGGIEAAGSQISDKLDERQLTPTANARGNVDGPGGQMSTGPSILRPSGDKAAEVQQADRIQSSRLRGSLMLPAELNSLELTKGASSDARALLNNAKVAGKDERQLRGRRSAPVDRLSDEQGQTIKRSVSGDSHSNAPPPTPMESGPFNYANKRNLRPLLAPLGSDSGGIGARLTSDRGHVARRERQRRQQQKLSHFISSQASSQSERGPSDYSRDALESTLGPLASALSARKDLITSGAESESQRINISPEEPQARVDRRSMVLNVNQSSLLGPSSVIDDLLLGDTDQSPANRQSWARPSLTRSTTSMIADAQAQRAMSQVIDGEQTSDHWQPHSSQAIHGRPDGEFASASAPIQPRGVQLGDGPLTSDGESEQIKTPVKLQNGLPLNSDVEHAGLDSAALHEHKLRAQRARRGLKTEHTQVTASETGNKLDTHSSNIVMPLQSDQEAIDLGPEFQPREEAKENIQTEGVQSDGASIEGAQMEAALQQGRPHGSDDNSVDSTFEDSDPSPGIGLNDDESLLWRASRYLYMHMRALASSSIYGVQVDVEWSNERANASATIERQFSSRAIGSPFATIDLVSGQSLQLECTAQALGRLPEVKWYKQIGQLPRHLEHNELAGKLKRTIGQSLFWPLTELDLLTSGAHEPDSDDTNGGEDGLVQEALDEFADNSFVCSRSTTIFDNLLNQTFTVVSSLTLSQYNDLIDLNRAPQMGELKEPAALIDEPLDQDPSPEESPAFIGRARKRHPLFRKRRDQNSHYNLYACIVDADIRHNYATLGVNFRQAPNSFRSLNFNERSMESNTKTRPSMQTRTQTLFSKESADEKRQVYLDPHVRQLDNQGNQKPTAHYSKIRSSHLSLPFRVPFRERLRANGSSYDSLEDYLYAEENHPLSSFPLSPLMLAIIIGFVSSSLLALVYLTLRSYQALTTYDSDTLLELGTEMHQNLQHDESDGNTQLGNQDTNPSSVDVALPLDGIIETQNRSDFDQSIDTLAYGEPDESKDRRVNERPSIDSISVYDGCSQIKTVANDSCSRSLYRAHYHNWFEALHYDELTETQAMQFISNMNKHPVSIDEFLTQYGLRNNEFECCAKSEADAVDDGACICEQVPIRQGSDSDHLSKKRVSIVTNPLDYDV